MRRAAIVGKPWIAVRIGATLYAYYSMSTSCRHVLLVGLVAGATGAACGPSAIELRQARAAHYQGSRDEVLRRAQAAVEGSYHVEAVDADGATLMTSTSRYEPDGRTRDPYRDRGRDRDREDVMAIRSEAGSVLLAFRIRVVGEAPPYQVVVEAIAQKMRSDYSAPDALDPDDPAMPGWISGKVDDLQLEVHHRLAH